MDMISILWPQDLQVNWTLLNPIMICLIQFNYEKSRCRGHNIDSKMCLCYVRLKQAYTCSRIYQSAQNFCYTHYKVHAHSLEYNLPLYSGYNLGLLVSFSFYYGRMLDLFTRCVNQTPYVWDEWLLFGCSYRLAIQTNKTQLAADGHIHIWMEEAGFFCFNSPKLGILLHC